MRYRVIVGRKLFQHTHVMDIEANSVKDAEIAALQRASVDEDCWPLQIDLSEGEKLFIEDLETRPDLP